MKIAVIPGVGMDPEIVAQSIHRPDTTLVGTRQMGDAIVRAITEP